MVSEDFVKFVLWEVRGSNPVDSQYNFYIWKQWPKNERHVAPSGWATCPHIIRPKWTRVITPLTNINQIKRTMSPPATSVRMVRPCHITVWTIWKGTVSIQKICLFGLADRSQYLLHTDSICESKYTTGIRKMRRTQWHCFRRISSTLNFEQNLIPWSAIKSVFLIS